MLEIPTDCTCRFEVPTGNLLTVKEIPTDCTCRFEVPTGNLLTAEVRKRYLLILN